MDKEKIEVLLTNYEFISCLDRLYKLSLDCAKDAYNNIPKYVCDGYSIINSDINSLYASIAAVTTVIQYMANKGFLDQDFLMKTSEIVYKKCAETIEKIIEAKRRELMKENEQSDNG